MHRVRVQGFERPYSVHIPASQSPSPLEAQQLTNSNLAIMSTSLENKVVIITGGALGTATARLLASLGAKIAFVFHTDVPAAEKTVASFSGQGHKAYGADLRTEAAVEKVFKDVKSDFGKIDIAINNVGKVLKRPITDLT